MHQEERLKFLREWFGMTQGKFANWIGVHQPNLSDMEMGRRTPPYRSLAALGVNINWLLGVDDEMWSHRLHSLRHQLRQRLISLTGDCRASVVNCASQADRIKYISYVAQDIDRDMVTDQLISALLLANPRDGIKESQPVRWREYFDIPLDVVLAGELGGLEDGVHPEYRTVCARLISKGITPLKLSQVLDILL